MRVRSFPRRWFAVAVLLGACGTPADPHDSPAEDPEFRTHLPFGPAYPSIPPEGLALWLDASDPGSEPTQWQDLATASRFAEVPSGCSAPQWVEHEPGLDNRSAFHFDGTSTCWSLPELYIHAKSTIFIVASASPQTEATGSWWRPLIAGAGRSFKANGYTYGIGLGRAGTSGLGVSLGCVQAGNAGVDCQNPGGAEAWEQKVFAPQIEQDGRYDVLRVTRDGTASDGVQIHRGEHLLAEGTLRRATGHGTGYTIGADPAAYNGHPARHYQGNIAEILVYNRVLAPTEVDEVNDYLEHKYNFHQRSMPRRALKVWLNASDKRTVHAAGSDGCRTIGGPASQIHDGERVQQWDDVRVTDFECRSGGDSDELGHDAIQNASYKQPSWDEDAVNGHPAVVFDGTDDLLGMNQLYLGPWASVFIVAQDEVQSGSGGSAWRPLLAHCGDPFDAAGSGYGVSLQQHGRGGLGAVLGNGTSIDDVEQPWSNEDGAFHLYSLMPDAADPTRMRLGVDGHLAGTGPRSRTTGYGTCYQLGAHEAVSARRYAGAIAEVIIYDPASEAERLTPDETAEVMRYLQTKYDLPGAAAERWHDYRRDVVGGSKPFPIGAWAFHREVAQESGENPYPPYAAAGLTFTQVPADASNHLQWATDSGVLAGVGSWRNIGPRFFSQPPGDPDDPADAHDPFYEDPDGTGEGAVNNLAAVRDVLGIEEVDPALYMLTDEPDRSEFAALGMAHRALMATDSSTPVPLLTVVPISFGTPDRFVAGDRASYEDYVAALIRETETGVLAATTYPILGSGPVGPISPEDYYVTLEVVREQTRRAGIGMFGFVLATGHEVVSYLDRDHEQQCYSGTLNRRFDSPSVTQLRRLAYTPLAYGAKGLVYYLWDRKDELRYQACGDPSRSWYQPGLAEDETLLAAATQINCEVQALGATLAQLDSTNVCHTGPNRPEGTKAHADLTSSVFPSFESDGELVVGEFRPLDALSHTRHAMLVNRSDGNPAAAYFDLPEAYSNPVRLVVDSECGVTTVALPGSSEWSIALEPGEAALLRFDPD